MAVADVNVKTGVNYAIQSHRINPLQLDYISATEISIKTMLDVKNAMEDIDDLSQDFSFCKPYQSPKRTKYLIQEFLDSTQLFHYQKFVKGDDRL